MTLPGAEYERLHHVEVDKAEELKDNRHPRPGVDSFEWGGDEEWGHEAGADFQRGLQDARFGH